jgi:dinuclear metal center YbgI/SA1388 family protein
MTAEELAFVLDELLNTDSTPDYPNAWNGLQVDRSGEVRRIAFAVDVSQASVEEAVRREADVLIVHHGLYWDGIPLVTGRRYRRLGAILRGNLGLYAAHLPLDVHKGVGNNIILAKELGIEVDGEFGEYRGVAIGVCGVLELRREALAARLDEVLGCRVRMITGGPERLRRVGVITGGGGGFIEAAREAGLDALVTGEGAHHNYFDAVEGGVNLYFGGHYATEVWGLKALSEHLMATLGLECFFIDNPTGL